MLTKKSAEDQTVPTSYTEHGIGNGRLFVPKGMLLQMNVVGVHYHRARCVIALMMLKSDSKVLAESPQICARPVLGA